MHVIHDRHADIYEAHEGVKWWTVARAPDGSWVVMSGTSDRKIKPDGALGKKLIAAVEAKIAKTG